MKKGLVMLSLLLCLVGYILSCKHEIPVTCADLNFKIAATKTDALLSNKNGTITVTAKGGDGFSYSLNGGPFKDSGYFNRLQPLVEYRVVGRNSLGCTDTALLTIGSFNPCQGVTINVTATKKDASLNKSDGSISATASGGSGITYSLDGINFQSNGNFSNLPAGNYTVTAKSDAGCIGTSAQVTIGTLDPCAGITVAIATTQTPATINKSDGIIKASATGGTGFTYSLNGGSFQSSGTFSGLATGNYTITAKNSNGCTGVTTVSLGVFNPCAGVTIVVNATKKDPFTGQTNGSITATATGSTGLTYSLNGGTFQTSGSFAGLAAGNYTITAKNSNGCTGVTTISLNAINPCAGITIVVSTTKTDPAAGQSNGSITANATGNTGFTYSLNGGAFQSSGSFTGLATGNYTVTAKNSNGCTGVTTVSLGTANPCAGITVAVNTTKTDATSGQSNGSITASATGGSGFTYSLNSGAFQTSGSFTGLAAGSYIITAKNSNGCTGITTVSISSINPCAGITIVVGTTKTDPTTGQSNGSITATAAGSTGFTYSLNSGTYQSGGTFSNLAAGTYTVTAKNANGCIGTTQVTLTAVSPCTNLNIVITPTVVNTTPCTTVANNGSINVAATGSTGFTYNINGGAYQTGNAFTSLAAGSYTIGVKDVNGCTQTQAVTVSVVAPGPTFTALRSLISSRCSGGGCHMNGSSSAGYNFDPDCNLVKFWNQINQACVTGGLKKMPLSPQPALTAAEKQVITNWVNAGHLYTK